MIAAGGSNIGKMKRIKVGRNFSIVMCCCLESGSQRGGAVSRGLLSNWCCHWVAEVSLDPPTDHVYTI